MSHGACISHTPSSTISSSARLAVPRKSAKLNAHLQAKLRQRARQQKRSRRFAFVIINVAIVAVIMAFVIQNPRTATTAKPLAADSSAITDTVANPLDQLSSADIAQTVAQAGNLPETTAIANQAQSQAADLAIASTNNDVISKPQVVATALKSKADIQTYVTVAGDTVSSLAAKFGVTSDSIRWSNNLSAADGLAPGTTLLIPPVNGVIYTVKAGDTPASLAAQFHSSADQIIAYNDAEISGLTPGERIIIPNASQNSGVSAALATITGINTGGLAWGTSPIYGSNGYDFGNCTWYVASQISVPANWGNANTWAYYAARSGWHVGATPSVGAIAQTGAGYFGHVAIVKAVNANGTITITEMNHAGFDVVDTRNVSASEFQNYITH